MVLLANTSMPFFCLRKATLIEISLDVVWVSIFNYNFKNNYRVLVLAQYT